MPNHQSWRVQREARGESLEYRAGYEQARRRYAIGKRVRELREAKSLSQAELARRMGTSQSVIARLELGGVEPRFDTLDRVAAALDSRLLVEITPLPGT